ncbi:tRNA A-37 threonylcarbamoyl transferase component Bud32 [Nocardioides ginsengisegetis]|uniref:non-specific serine/threonine protein kinase n=1 Tax=Nocardioides ginsengisegetis TaxID=661491 RepID=A0A7W3IYK4_9ACTN|nr:serine/threonine-protein kinase [Nocardioides ginsengisegetis]MBA8802968.1 tRNA A-37 threonylcarbamoyl transferase component Bud32 [Nocardioides ginsengisegetis]
MDEGAVPAGYELVRVLGAGGFGEVVLARHTALHRMVAVKRIHAVALADADSVARFRREAKLLASLDCPSVVRVYDLTVGTRQAHLVMEYVPGEALSDIVARGPLPGPEAVRVLRDVADALTTAAGHGIVHRDVKPHNVFVLPDGHAKLGDFGLARAVSDPSVFRTDAASAIGTPAYFPPELGLGQGEPDARSDAYSFAIVAYEALTGRRPYDAPDALALISAHWRLEPPDPRSLLPGLPAKAANVLLAGLAKDPADRPLPDELVARLEAIPTSAWPAVERRPAPPRATQRSAPTVRVEAPTAPAPPPPRRWPRRRVLVGAAGLAVLLGVGGVAWATHRPAPAVTVDSVRLTSDPDPASVVCPDGTVRLDAAFATNGGAGAFTVRWTGPDGTTLSERRVAGRSGQHTVRSTLRLDLSGPRPITGDVTVAVVGSDVRASRAVRYRCPSR